MTKDRLRAMYRAKRQNLSAETVTAASEQIARQWQTLARNDASVIHVFLPIRSHNEVDTWPIINLIWQHYPADTVVTSRTDFDTGSLTHYALTPQSSLLVNRYGIPEPDPATGTPIPASGIDVVLVPLLIFDRQGHRVGYGKGFYDRFLANCRPDCRKVGVSLFEPVERIDGVTAMDIALDSCVTPEQVWIFS